MQQETYDLVILGCGPAGLSAAINAMIRNKKVLVLGDEVCSPPLHKAMKIDNYLGLPDMSGNEILEKFMQHALRMKVNIRPARADMINEVDGLFNILIGDDMIQTRSIVIATGIPYKPTLSRENEFLGKGLGYCATCDGTLYRDRDVLIISHSEEGEGEADFMAEICRKVYYIPLYRQEPKLDQRIEVLTDKPVEIIGSDTVEGCKLKNGQIINVDGIFVLGGETAPDRLIPGLILEDNHIVVNRQQETNLPGVFAAGDCTGAPYQVAKSVGEGQVAGLNAARYASRR